MQNQFLDDKHMLADILKDYKLICSHYNTAGLESADTGARELFQRLHSQSHHEHEIVFRFMHVRGMYPIRDADASQISQVSEQYHR